MRTIFWLENFKGRDHLNDLGIDEKIGKQGGRLCSGCIWIGIGTSGRLL